MKVPCPLWSLWEIMYKFDAGSLFARIVGLSNFTGSMPHGRLPSAVIPLENYSDLKKNIDFVCGEVEALELASSVASARKLKELIHSAGKPVPAAGLVDIVPRDFLHSVNDWIEIGSFELKQIEHCSRELVGRFRDELTARTVVTVSPRHAKYLNNPALFGNDVFNAFPSANEDIAEAGSCLTFERGTACVMHLMRASEVGLTALASTLGVGKQNDWGSYLREIEKEISKRVKASGARTADEQFYSESAASFDHLKRAWRNPTMHVDRTYSVDRAEEIFDAVGSFLKQLSIKIKEGPLL